MFSSYLKRFNRNKNNKSNYVFGINNRKLFMNIFRKSETIKVFKANKILYIKSSKANTSANFHKLNNTDRKIIYRKYSYARYVVFVTMNSTGIYNKILLINQNVSTEAQDRIIILDEFRLL